MNGWSRRTGHPFSVGATCQEGLRAEGVHYRFINEEQFDQLLREDALLEHATVHDHRYGTPRKPVEDALRQGLDVLLDVDSQGALNIMKKIRHCVSVFILPPSFSSLEVRLHTRNTDDEAEIKKRLDNAREEISKYTLYDYALVNDELDTALRRLQCIISAERLRTLRFHPEIPEYQRRLMRHGHQ